MRSLRIFFHGGLVAYRGLFNWAHPSIYIPTMLGAPLFQILFFAYLGRYSGLADDDFFVAGNAIVVSAMAGVYGMVMMIANERQLGTLSSVLATPANRLALFCGRMLPVIANGLFVSAFGFGVGFVLLGFRVPAGGLPALAVTVAVAAASGTAFGLVLGAVAMRANDLWISSNLAYYLLLLLCGANVPLSVLPDWLAAVGRALPFTHGIEAVRRLEAGAPISDVAGLIGREALTGAAYAGLGYALLWLFEAEGRRRASLAAA
jgi:ABC-2 type transport system permease protein